MGIASGEKRIHILRMGGGIRYVLPIKQVKKGKGTRRWKGMSYHTRHDALVPSGKR